MSMNALASHPKQTAEIVCLVCGSNTYDTICPADEVKVHQEYLLRFHSRRLHRDQNGCVPEAALMDRMDFTQDYATDIVACTKCGLVFRNPRPTEEAVATKYAKDKFGHAHLTAAFEAELKLSRRKTKTLDKWLPRRPRTLILEVGSFVGGFLAAGREWGWNMLGIDPGKEVTAFCNERGLPVHRGTLADAGLKPESVDCLAIWNTFDQLPDPHSTLATAQRLLRPGGTLVIRVPNGACFKFAEAWMGRLPRLAQRWLMAMMAWNNLLAFPYLIGYSLETLNHLTARYRMEPLAVYPDTLVPLADRQTKTWAAWEEKVVKLSWRAGWSYERLQVGSSLCTAPWFDVYYRFNPYGTWLVSDDQKSHRHAVNRL